MSGDTPLHILAHAKLNLWLRVLAREVSGYHQIETLFCALELADRIEISSAPHGVSLDVAHDDEGAGTDLGPIEHNLAWRAAVLFARAASVDRGVHIHLTKRIPAGAGLGGGSSDAAAVLHGLNQLHSKPVPADDLLALGAQLGSDVPFFLTRAPLALAWGRGDRILPLPPLPHAAVVLAVPPQRISTPDAYGSVGEIRPPAPVTLEFPETWSRVAAAAHNDFEEPIFAQYPRFGALRRTLRDSGALIARMTGSGSVIFGVFNDATVAHRAADGIAAAHADVRTIVTSTHKPA